MLCSGNKRFLLRERCDDEDQFIEIRCKESERKTPLCTLTFCLFMCASFANFLLKE